jgi:N-acetylmuramate 1-kinase
MSRTAAISAFLARHGYARAGVVPLAQDASFRRYLRLSGGPRPAVLMDAPPPEDVRTFLRTAAHLASIGLSVPEIIAADEAEGLVLEEDLGDALLSTLAKTHPSPAGVAQRAESALPAERRPSAPIPLAPAAGEPSDPWDAAIDTLVALQRAAPPPVLPAWDANAMTQAALGTLLDWWWPAVFCAPAPDNARADFAAALETTLAPLANGPHCFVHRDYFAGNLIWLPLRQGPRRIGLLDFQTAALGSPAYDLVSLVQDARQEMPTELADRTLRRYLAARPEIDPVAFEIAFAACAAHRHLRVACQWVRLAQRDRRPQYLPYGPRTWKLLAAALRHPAATQLAAVMDHWIPVAARGNPPGRIA